MAISRNHAEKSQPAQRTETDLRHHSQELGWLGKAFGSKENAPIYFAGILALIALFSAVAVGIWAPEMPEKSDLIKALIGITIAALSFIGGASGRPHS